MRDPVELLANRADLIGMALSASGAQAASGDPQALFSWSTAADAYFMQALIRWRTGIGDPQTDLRATVGVAEAAAAFVRTHRVGIHRYRYAPLPGAYAAVLVDRPSSPAVSEALRVLDSSAPATVRPLDRAEGFLLASLAGGDAGEGPSIAAQAAMVGRTALWGRTMLGYFGLLGVDEGDPARAASLTSEILALFKERRRDRFIGGGPEFNGGEGYNDVVVDFRVAAVWRVRGWDRLALRPDERVHAELP